MSASSTTYYGRVAYDTNRNVVDSGQTRQGHGAQLLQSSELGPDLMSQKPWFWNNGKD